MSNRKSYFLIYMFRTSTGILTEKERKTVFMECNICHQKFYILYTVFEHFNLMSHSTPSLNYTILLQEHVDPLKKYQFL